MRWHPFQCVPETSIPISVSPFRLQSSTRGLLLSCCEKCNTQGWLGPSGRQGWLEGIPGKIYSCGQEGWPPNVHPALCKSREQLEKKWQVQKAAPHSPTKTQGLGSTFYGAKSRCLDFQRPLSVPGHYGLSAPDEVVADRLPR